MNKEDFVHKRNRDKGNFYSKDFTLEEVNQLIEDKKDAEKWRSMSRDLDTGGMWQIQQDRLELAEAIVEGLKEFVKKYSSLKPYKDEIDPYFLQDIQKILGEDNITAHIGGVTFGEKK